MILTDLLHACVVIATFHIREYTILYTYVSQNINEYKYIASFQTYISISDVCKISFLQEGEKTINNASCQV